MESVYCEQTKWKTKGYQDVNKNEVKLRKIKPNEEKVEAILKLNPPEKQKSWNLFSEQYIYDNIPPETFETDRPIVKTIEKKMNNGHREKNLKK